MAERPVFFGDLLPRLQEMRQRTGRPHWIIADEAHHMLGPVWAPAFPEPANRLQNLILITVHPDHVSPAALKAVDGVVAIGARPDKAAQEFANVRGIAVLAMEGTLESDQAFVWFPPGIAYVSTSFTPSGSVTNGRMRTATLGRTGRFISAAARTN
ncbi:MAG TPA: hypothetical protein VMJ75_14465 [Candidatus Acidoferrales bacterium]|nr:hypothetical protein [Candidatus Acidoferrales bacterium]